jgi:hypothetical protein
MINNTKIQKNDWYLKLDGKLIYLKIPPVQTAESDLDVTSAGSIERNDSPINSIIIIGVLRKYHKC